MANHTKEILKKIVLVNVECGIWSGYKRTSDSDLNKMGTKIPPGGIITKGGKQIFPREPLKGFTSLKKEISRKLTSMGVAVLGGSARAIPADSMKDVEKYLTKAEAKYMGLIASFAASYDANLRAHLNEITDPVVREVVANSTLNQSDAVGRFRFMWDIFKVDPQRGSGNGLVSNLSEKLFTEIGQAASEIYTKSFLGKPRVGTRALNQIVALRDKMAGLSMLDGQTIQPVVDQMDAVLNRMPKNGWIENVEYSALVGLVKMLSDPESMLAHAAKINAGTAATTAKVAQPQAVTTDTTSQETAPATQTMNEAKAIPATADLWSDTPPAEVAPPAKEEAPTAVETEVVAAEAPADTGDSTPVEIVQESKEPEVETPDVKKEEKKPEPVLPLLPTSRIGRVASASFF